MSIQEREHRAVLEYLKSLNIHYLDDWVFQCINSCKSANPNLSLDVIKNKVKEEWLLVDLREFKVQSLPPNLAKCQKTILKGNYMVQVESMIDCSKSFYSQLLNIQDKEVEDKESSHEWSKKNYHRCLTFIITDGIQELNAMEYKPIKKIKTNDSTLLPGFKMLITGPVECRRGMLLLKEENVQIFGGKVDKLVTSHNLKSILINKLNLNEEDYPEICNFKTNEENHCKEKIENLVENSTNCFGLESDNIESLLSQNDDLFLSLPLDNQVFYQSKLLDSTKMNTHQESSENNNAKQTIENSKNLNQYDSGILSDIFNEEFSFSKFFVTNPKKHSLTFDDKTTPCPKKMTLAPFCDNQIPLLENVCSKQNLSKSLTNSRHTIDYTWENSSDQYLSEVNSFQAGLSEPNQNNNHSFDSETSTINFNPSSAPQKSTIQSISHQPFVYLKQILATEIKRPKIFKVKAIILTLKKKITIEKDKFNLRGIITDGSESIDADFSSCVLENILDYSPCEIQAMVKAKQQNSAMESRIKEAFKKAQEKFISLNCLINIKFFPSKITPIILSLEEVTSHHLNALKERTSVYK